MLYCLTAIIIIILDQFVKYLIRSGFALGETREFIRGIISLTYVRNTGAAFNIFKDMRWILMLLAAVFIIVIFIILRKRIISHPAGTWPLVLIASGALGNLIDRAMFGYVVDMFQFDFVRFAIFNVADCFITCGGIWFCVYFAFFYEKLERSPVGYSKIKIKLSKEEKTGDSNNEPPEEK